MSDADAEATAAVDARARKRERRARWASRIAGVGVRILARTWRVREVHQGPKDIVRQHERPVIFCLWHCELLCHMWNFRGLGIVVLISEHGDGEIAARAAESMGYRTIRGSSRRGAERALLSLAREVEGGAHVAVTPDGPRGPAESFAPGALIAAQRSGAPIVLLRAVADRAWRLRSWDRFIIPKPFARLTIYVSEPVFVHAPSLRAAADEAPRFQALMRALPTPSTHVAERTAVEWVWWGTSVGARATRALLAPASLAFGAIVRVRNALYDRKLIPARAPRIPTVSVGNLTVGGTGKTPVSSWLAMQLQAREARPAIVLRGYGDDEPLVHARLTPDIPVIVNANRVEAIARAADDGAGVAVLDDGFQHRRVMRTADVVLVSADAPDAPVRLLPSGPYREGMQALGRASLVIVTRKAASLAQARAVAAMITRVVPGVPVSIVHLALDAVHFGSRAPAPLASIAGRRVLAIAGVGNAAAFGDQLRQAGAIVRLRAFGDHHPFTEADATALARDLGADEIALCTLKDAVKLLPLWPREAAAIGYVSQAVIVEENGGAIDSILELVAHARLRQH